MRQGYCWPVQVSVFFCCKEITVCVENSRRGRGTQQSVLRGGPAPTFNPYVLYANFDQNVPLRCTFQDDNK